MASSVTSQVRISEAAIEKLRQHTESWNLANPEKRVLPALYVRRGGEKKNVRLGVGFLENSKLRDEMLITKNGLSIIVDFSEDDFNFVKAKRIDFNGEIFELLDFESSNPGR